MIFNFCKFISFSASNQTLTQMNWKKGFRGWNCFKRWITLSAITSQILKGEKKKEGISIETSVLISFNLIFIIAFVSNKKFEYCTRILPIRWIYNHSSENNSLHSLKNVFNHHIRTKTLLFTHWERQNNSTDSRFFLLSQSIIYLKSCYQLRTCNRNFIMRVTSKN